MEDHLRVGREALGAGEDLKGHVFAHDLDHLGEFSAHGSQFVITHPFGAQRDGGLGNVVYFRINLLKCTCCHTSGLFGNFIIDILFDLPLVVVELLGLPLGVIHLAEEVD